MLDSGKLDIFDLKKIKINRTAKELEEAGKEMRTKVSSEQLAEFVPVHRDAVAAIKKTESKMIQELLPLHHERMLASKFAFFRGTAELMEQDLKDQYQSHIPLIICGDAHVNNYGFYASPERQLIFGLNDFDESRIGNWESDLKRLLVSTRLAGEENGFSDEQLDSVLHLITKTYRHSIKHNDKLSLFQRLYSSYEIHDMIAAIDTLNNSASQMNEILNKIIKKSSRSNSEQIVKKMTKLNENGQLRFSENAPRAKHVNAEKYAEILQGFNHYRNNVRQDIRIFLGNFSIKEAMPLRYNLLRLPTAEAIKNGVLAGRRIVTAQRTLQASSDPFLGSTSFGGRSYYVRQFRDMKESIKVNKLDYESFNLYCQICSTLLAIAHFQSPTAPMVRGYLKGQKALDDGLVEWTNAYAKQVAIDFDDFRNSLQDNNGLITK